MHGRRTALLDGERAVTFNEFYNRVLRCGQALKALGVARGDRVAVLMLNSPSYLELYFGIASIGAAIVPVNTRWSTADNAAVGMFDRELLRRILSVKRQPRGEKTPRSQQELDFIHS